MKLSVWAREAGISYLTAYKWFKAGILPVNAYQMPTGTIIINEEIKKSKKERNVIYCRVSNQSRKKELDYQVNRCLEYCRINGWSIDVVYKEVASGMNDNRKKLLEMIKSKPTRIIVENKDRLTRFGFNYLEILLDKLGCDIEVINKEKIDETDLIKDMVSIMTSFCYRLYGLRRGQNKAIKLKEILNDKNN